MADTPQSIITNIHEYGLDTDGMLTFASFGEASAGFGKLLKTSYNNFLGGCRLQLSNIGHAPSSVEISATRYEGTSLSLPQSEITIDGDSTIEVNICSIDETSSYGEVSIIPSSTERIIGYLIRESSAISRFKTSLRPRSLCLADISITNSPLSLQAEGAPGSIVVTNTSSVSATNIQSEFKGTALEGQVTETQNTCGTLEAGSSCTLSFTPGNTAVPLTEFSIFADNVKAVPAQMEIASPQPIALIGVNPSSLSFSVNSSASVTVTNNSTTSISADNIAATIPGGSDISVQSTTCGASLGVGASCSITFTSPHHAGPVSVAIAGTNTNSLNLPVTVTQTAQISITGPSMNERMVSVGSQTPLSLEVTNDAASVVNVNSLTISNTTNCSGISVDDSNCASLAPGASCTLHLTSTLPYAPCEITISGDNAGNSPSTLVAFNYLGGIVFEEENGIGKVVTEPLENNQEATSQWTSVFTTIAASSSSNGVSNTDAIVADNGCSDNPGSCAAQRCRDIGPDWYLPAANELTAANSSLCSNQGIPCNFGSFVAGVYHSSTSLTMTAANMVSFPSGDVNPFMKTFNTNVRCIRSFTP
jgi:hypothetical protein